MTSVAEPFLGPHKTAVHAIKLGLSAFSVPVLFVYQRSAKPLMDGIMKKGDLHGGIPSGVTWHVSDAGSPRLHSAFTSKGEGMPLTQEQLLHMYWTMLTIRAFEGHIRELWKQDFVSGT